MFNEKKFAKIAPETRKKGPSEIIEKCLQEVEIDIGEAILLDEVEELFQLFPEFTSGLVQRHYSTFADAVFSQSSKFFSSTPRERFSRRRGNIVISSYREPFNLAQKRMDTGGTTELVEQFGKESRKEVFVTCRLTIKPGQPENEVPSKPQGYTKRSPDLVFIYSMTDEHARTICNAKGANRYHGFEQFTFRGIFFEPDSPHELRVPIKKAIDESLLPEGIDSVSFSKSLETFMPLREADCSAALKKLQRLGAEKGIDIEKMSDAIIEFATMVKPEPTTGEACFAEIGRCISIPPIFKDFCKRHQLNNVETDSYGNNVDLYHQVNVWEGIAIDWTARQFRKLEDSEYPRIYDASEVLFGKYTLFKQLSKEEQDEMIRYEREMDKYRLR